MMSNEGETLLEIRVNGECLSNGKRIPQSNLLQHDKEVYDLFMSWVASCGEFGQLIHGV